jgi:hypothetical protein
VKHDEQSLAKKSNGSGAVYVVATVALFLLLSGVLAYAYPHFLPGPPEQAVRRFLVAQQAGTWDYVGYVLQGPVFLREDYIRAAGQCKLMSFEISDAYSNRMRWATGKSSDMETVRVREHYSSTDGKRIVTIEVEYTLHRHGGEWFIELDSLLGEGGIRDFLYKRGVPI